MSDPAGAATPRGPPVSQERSSTRVGRDDTLTTARTLVAALQAPRDRDGRHVGRLRRGRMRGPPRVIVRVAARFEGQTRRSAPWPSVLLRAQTEDASARLLAGPLPTIGPKPNSPAVGPGFRSVARAATKLRLPLCARAQPRQKYGPGYGGSPRCRSFRSGSVEALRRWRGEDASWVCAGSCMRAGGGCWRARVPKYGGRRPNGLGSVRSVRLTASVPDDPGRCSVMGAIVPSARRCTGCRRVLRP